MRNLLCLFLFALSLTAWSQKLEIEAVQQLGGLRLGLSLAEVKRSLGPPAREGKEVLEAATGLTVKNLLYPTQGLTITVSRENEQAPWQVERFKAQSPCQLRTPQGIGIGTSALEARKVYGPLIDKESSSPDQWVVGSPYGGLILGLEKGKVRSLFVGAAAE